MGHTAGLGKGFAILALIVFGAIAVVSGIAYGLAAFFQNPYVFAPFTAAAATGLAYLFYQPRGVCLKAGFSGLVGGAAGSLVTATLGGILGVFAGMVVSAVVLFVVLFVILAFGRSSRTPGAPSVAWRQSKKK